MMYTVYFTRMDNGETIMKQDFQTHEEAVEVAEMFANSDVGYQIVEHNSWTSEKSYKVSPFHKKHESYIGKNFFLEKEKKK